MSGVDPIVFAQFRAVTELEITNLKRQDELLWQSLNKRQKDLDVIRSRISWSLVSIIGFLAAVILGMIRTKIGL